MPLQLIHLSPQDNVLIAPQNFAAGDEVALLDGSIRLAAPLLMGHKLAARAINEGETITKYGAPIGRATRAIAAGEHVHLHNVVSNYTATHVIE